MLGGAAALQRLEELADSPDGQVVERALGGLAALAPERAEQRLRTLSASDDPAKLRAAMSYAHMLPSDTSLAVATRSLGSHDPELVGIALSQLSMRGYISESLQAPLQIATANSALSAEQRQLARHLLAQATGVMPPETSSTIEPAAAPAAEADVTVAPR
jgi:hypothetical protein